MTEVLRTLTVYLPLGWNSKGNKEKFPAVELRMKIRP